MNRLQWTGSLALLAVALLAVGCAGQRGPDPNLAAIETRLDRLEGELSEARRLAAEAQRSAAAAALRADEAARTSEAIFATRVAK